jgi:hypothetical protein
MIDEAPVVAVGIVELEFVSAEESSASGRIHDEPGSSSERGGR